MKVNNENSDKTKRMGFTYLHKIAIDNIGWFALKRLHLRQHIRDYLQTHLC